MADDYARKVESDNKHLSNLTSARFVHVGASSSETVRTSGGRLLRVVLNTNGGVVTLRDGDRVIANIASDAPEGTYNYGVYFNDELIVETGANCDVTVVFGN